MEQNLLLVQKFGTPSRMNLIVNGLKGITVDLLKMILLYCVCRILMLYVIIFVR